MQKKYLFPRTETGSDLLRSPSQTAPTKFNFDPRSSRQRSWPDFIRPMTLKRLVIFNGL